MVRLDHGAEVARGFQGRRLFQAETTKPPGRAKNIC